MLLINYNKCHSDTDERIGYERQKFLWANLHWKHKLWNWMTILWKWARKLMHYAQIFAYPIHTLPSQILIMFTSCYQTFPAHFCNDVSRFVSWLPFSSMVLIQIQFVRLVKFVELHEEETAKRRVFAFICIKKSRYKYMEKCNGLVYYLYVKAHLHIMMNLKVLII